MLLLHQDGGDRTPGGQAGVIEKMAKEEAALGDWSSIETIDRGLCKTRPMGRVQNNRANAFQGRMQIRHIGRKRRKDWLLSAGDAAVTLFNIAGQQGKSPLDGVKIVDIAAPVSMPTVGMGLAGTLSISAFQAARLEVAEEFFADDNLIAEKQSTGLQQAWIIHKTLQSSLEKQGYGPPGWLIA